MYYYLEGAVFVNAHDHQMPLYIEYLICTILNEIIAHETRRMMLARIFFLEIQDYTYWTKLGNSDLSMIVFLI